MSAMVASVAGTLERWRAPTAEQSSLREAYLALLTSCPDALWRSHRAGHVTASAVVLSPDLDAVALVLHPRGGAGLSGGEPAPNTSAWLPPGGHLEPGDPDLSAAALREVAEETGLVDFATPPALIRLDAHPFRCRSGATRHLDCCFVMRAKARRDGTPPPLRISEESEDLRWWPVTALPSDASGGRLASAVSTAVHHYAREGSERRNPTE